MVVLPSRSVLLGVCAVIASSVQSASGQLASQTQYSERLHGLESNSDQHPVFLLRMLRASERWDQESFSRYLQLSNARIQEMGGGYIFLGKAQRFEIDFAGAKRVPGFRLNPWDYVLVERYRSRKDLVRLSKSKDYRAVTLLLENMVGDMVLYAIDGSPWSEGASRSKAESFTSPVESSTPGDALYMLNLLKFKPGGKDRFRNDYAAAVVPLIKQKYNGQVICGFGCEQLLVGAEEYDRVILVRYPSENAFRNMLLSDEYQAVSHHRTESIEIGHLYGFSNMVGELKKSDQR